MKIITVCVISAIARVIYYRVMALIILVVYTMSFQKHVRQANNLMEVLQSAQLVSNLINMKISASVHSSVLIILLIKAVYVEQHAKATKSGLPMVVLMYVFLNVTTMLLEVLFNVLPNVTQKMSSIMAMA